MTALTRTDTPVAIEGDGVELRMRDVGGDMTVAFVRFPKGTDMSPALKGQPDDLCQCPHWGFVLRGQLTTTDAQGARETVNANDLFYWPSGHNVKVDADAEIVMFSPQHEHSLVIDHMIAKVAG